ncbi:major facilitator superfamily domain-containing protein [Phyllosticta paracitricarpa]|uniref:Major facilitator superfamily domain-containing protein n=1 Tax=Phyllosticta paracitricarpa TaxID=2016321 RepID=A0ABR1N7Y5_9PEZI
MHDHEKEPTHESTSQEDHDLEAAEEQPHPASSSSSVSDKDDGAAPGLQRSTTRSSTVSRPPTMVPRKERRGLLSNLSLIPEVTNPYEYSRKIKWTITAVVAFTAAAAPMGSAILLPALSEVTADLNTTATIANMTVSFYMLAMSIFPLWWSSFSETLGRRNIYLISFTFYLIFQVLSAVSTNISMLIVMRVFAGGASASVQAVGGGTIADVWEVKERGRGMGIFYLGPLCGPLFAPIIGGALAQGLGWRSTQWFLLIYGGIVWLTICFCLPETLHRKPAVPKTDSSDPLAGANTTEEIEASVSGMEKLTTNPALQRVSTRQSTQVKAKNYLGILRRCFLDPLGIILYLQFPAIFLVVSYATMAFASLYVLNISVEATFKVAPYNFSTLIVGLLYIPNSLGYMFTSVFGGRWIDYIMHREARRKNRVDPVTGKLHFLPEDRMRENAWLGCVLFPGALVWYGWTAEKGVFWLVPMVANFFFGIGSMLIFSMVTTMLTEFMPKKASNGIALNNFVRNIFSCVGSVVAQPLIDAIGDGWLFTGLAVISFVWGTYCIWAMAKYGEQWRKRMDGHKMFA